MRNRSGRIVNISNYRRYYSHYYPRNLLLWLLYQGQGVDGSPDSDSPLTALWRKDRTGRPEALIIFSARYAVWRKIGEGNVKNWWNSPSCVFFYSDRSLSLSHPPLAGEGMHFANQCIECVINPFTRADSLSQLKNSDAWWDAQTIESREIFLQRVWNDIWWIRIM